MSDNTHVPGALGPLLHRGATISGYRDEALPGYASGGDMALPMVRTRFLTETRLYGRRLSSPLAVDLRRSVRVISSRTSRGGNLRGRSPQHLRWQWRTLFIQPSAAGWACDIGGVPCRNTAFAGHFVCFLGDVVPRFPSNESALKARDVVLRCVVPPPMSHGSRRTVGSAASPYMKNGRAHCCDICWL